MAGRNVAYPRPNMGYPIYFPHDRHRHILLNSYVIMVGEPAHPLSTLQNLIQYERTTKKRQKNKVRTHKSNKMKRAILQLQYIFIIRQTSEMSSIIFIQVQHNFHIDLSIFLFTLTWTVLVCYTMYLCATWRYSCVMQVCYNDQTCIHL